MSRFLRCIVCFLLICCILVNCSPLRADATAAGAAGVITGAATVSVSAPMVIGATLIALGLYAGVNGTDGIEAVAQSAVSHLESAGTYIKDGCVELLQTVNSAGEKAYYVAGDFIDFVRDWAIGEPSDGSVVTVVSSLPYSSDATVYPAFSECYSICLSYPYHFLAYQGGSLNRWICGYSSASPFVFVRDDPASTSYGYDIYQVKRSDYERLRYFVSDNPYSSGVGSGSQTSGIGSISYFDTLNYSSDLSYSTSYDLTLGSLPSQTTDLTDGTSARAWSETMTNNGLKVIEGGGSDPEPPDENNGKWFWPLALTVTAAELWAMSQVDEWSGKTPQEFDDYRTQTEFEILSRPEVEFGQGIEIAPVTSPSPDPGTNPNPGTNPDQDGSEEVKTDYTTWFSRLYTSVENIAGKFDEIPNKFQSWISDLKTDIQTQTDKLAEHASNTLAAIQSLPESFAESLADLKSAVLSVPNSIKEFFTPKQPSNHTQFALGDLSKFFPFCIPFDLFDFFTLLDADPVAPVFSWEIQDLSGQTYGLTVDLSQWDSVAQLFRRLQLFLFVCGLAAASRKFIKW